MLPIHRQVDHGGRLLLSKDSASFHRQSVVSSVTGNNAAIYLAQSALVSPIPAWT